MESRTVMVGSGRKEGEVEGPAPPVCTERLGGSEKDRPGSCSSLTGSPGCVRPGQGCPHLTIHLHCCVRSSNCLLGWK